MSGTLARQLDHIESLVDAKKLEQAQRELIPLCQRYPNRPEPLSWLVRVSQRLNDHDELQHACERLLRLTPGERDVTLLWAGSSLASARPATARRAILRFLAQWPDDPVAEKMHEQLRDIEAHFRSFLGCYALPDDAMWELADQHEQVLMLLSRRQPERSREAAQKLLARHPSFVPGWNNLGLALFYLGDLAGSIGACQRVLEIEPENFQALSNLIRGLALANQRDDALALAPRLKAAQSNSADLHVKKAEALAMLSDDEGVLEQLKEAEAHRPLDLEEDARLFHYAAVAALHQGDEPRARELWRRALQLDPRLSIARGNLDDLAEAPERREGPWAFDMVNLIPEAWLARLALHRDKSRASRDQVRRVLERNPQIVAAAPPRWKWATLSPAIFSSRWPRTRACRSWWKP
jgi:tetratricopeptide (TPR) repeat protein